jgi:hypothetical protein
VDQRDQLAVDAVTLYLATVRDLLYAVRSAKSFP